MPTFRSIRKRFLTPDISATKVSVRGFNAKSPTAVERLEAVGETFLKGFSAAAGARVASEVADELSGLSSVYQGFAYEGAGMGLAILDGLPMPGRGRVERFLAGPGDAHIYMVYVGVGWAMARLPRFRWSALHAPDPLLRWLVLDGYGFHQAYFHTQKYVHKQFHEDRFGWPADGPAWHAAQVIDQGIGRAIWFVGGADPAVVTRLIQAFPQHRQPDLYSGAGLAATYAGAADESELELFRELAAPYQAQVAQGAAFAAAARLRAGLVVPHNEVATRILCGGATVAEAAAVTDAARIGLRYDESIPAYATWRRRIAEEFLRRPAVAASAQASRP